MFLKRLLTGVLTAMMITGMCSAGVSAADKKDIKAYVAELEKTTYNGNDLGANYSEKSTTFKVWSPKASSVKLNLYEHGSDEEGDAGSYSTKNMQLDKKTGVWSIKVDGNLAGKYYTYSVKHGDEVKETGDVYAKACGVNGKRSMVVDLASTNPEGWENDVHVTVSNATNASVWEVSVADFSSSESSGVSNENRGKFRAFTEKGTTVNGVKGAESTCVDYLKKLGVKYVQIMPFYDFGSVDESKDIMSQYNWGYDPVNYNVPEGSYSSNPFDGNVRIKECKEMVQALHNAGIGVIMDVVYNHTYSTESVFQYTVPNYYYRMNSDGTLSNGSYCSNDTASENKMFRKYMIDSVSYWVKEYHIDGFRFDLMGLHDVDTLNEIRATLDNLYEDGSGKRILMYGEAWNMSTAAKEGTVMAHQGNLKKLNDRIGAFDDTIRDAIKGSTGGTDGAFVQEGTSRSKVKVGIAGQSDNSSGWANVPTQHVTYASCHDNLCLYDKLVDSVYGRKYDYRKRYEDLVAMNKLTGAIVITSQGIPFMLAGEEFARSKDGDENSYASSREENMIDWNNISEYSDIVEYYRGLYQIRDAFAAFRDCTAMSANSIAYLSDVPKTVIAYTLANTEKDKWEKVCVIFNGGAEAETVKVDGEWVIVADNKTAGLRNLGEVTEGSVEVQAHSAVILADKKGYEKAALAIDEGAVVVNYYDNETKKVISTQTITGAVGSTFNLAENAFGLDYDIKETKGEISGVFTEGVLHTDVYVKKYDGEYSTVTFRFVDNINGSDLVDYYSIRNRTGQMYFTPDLPSIENYKLVMEELPANGSGVLTDKDIEVIYKYTRVTDDADKSICTVNAIYMDNNGKILEKKTITGKEGETYTLPQNEYEEMSLVAVPENSSGNFKTGEINVIFTYMSEPDPWKMPMVVVFAAAGVILTLCVASVLLSGKKKTKRFAATMDIDE